MDKDVTDSRFGANEEVHIQVQIWQCNVAVCVSYFGSFGMHSCWTDVLKQVARQK